MWNQKVEQMPLKIIVAEVMKHVCFSEANDVFQKIYRQVMSKNSVKNETETITRKFIQELWYFARQTYEDKPSQLLIKVRSKCSYLEVPCQCGQRRIVLVVERML